MLVCLSGPSGSGKDEVGKILVQRYGFIRLAFADPLKAFLEALNPMIVVDHVGQVPIALPLSALLEREGGWENAKKIPAVRSELQKTGSAARNHFGKQHWIHQTDRKYLQLIKETGRHVNLRVVITDGRQPNEYDYVTVSGGENWLIERENFVNTVGTSHESEQHFDWKSGYFTQKITNPDHRNWPTVLRGRIHSALLNYKGTGKCQST